MRSLLAIMTILALGACNGTANDSKESKSLESNVVNPVAEITALPEAARNAVFLRAIRDAGLDCQDILKGERLEPMGEKATWRVQCEDGASHLVLVNQNGSAEVVSRITP